MHGTKLIQQDINEENRHRIGKINLDRKKL